MQKADYLAADDDEHEALHLDHTNTYPRAETAKSAAMVDQHDQKLLIQLSSHANTPWYYTMAETCTPTINGVSARPMTPAAPGVLTLVPWIAKIGV